MERKLNLSANFNIAPNQLFNDWLDSQAHSAFTSSPAKIDALVGGKFTAWDGYIRGVTMEIVPGKRIVQSWRTTEFPNAAPDSLVELEFEADGKGTRLMLKHTLIPDGQADEYEQGWLDYYFTPMKAYYLDK